MPKEDVTSIVERVEATEKRVGVRLDAISAFYYQDEFVDGYSVQVLGDILAVDEIVEDFSVVAGIYDSNNRLVGRDDYPVFSDEYFGFESFEIHVEGLPCRVPGKVRVSIKGGG